MSGTSPPPQGKALDRAMSDIQSFQNLIWPRATHQQKGGGGRVSVQASN